MPGELQGGKKGEKGHMSKEKREAGGRRCAVFVVIDEREVQNRRHLRDRPAFATLKLATKRPVIAESSRCKTPRASINQYLGSALPALKPPDSLRNSPPAPVAE